MSMEEWLTGFAGASPLEWIATLSGFFCVYLIIQRSIWCFAFGFVQVTIYSWIFYDVKLYADMALHIFYMGFQVYGWWIWSRNMDDSGHIEVVPGSSANYLSWMAVGLVTALVIGYLLNTYSDASLPYADAFTTCFSLIAQWLMSHKRLLNWSFWIIVDIVAIWVYWQKGLYPTSALYGCFLVMACIGQWQWLTHWRRQSRQTSQMSPLIDDIAD